MPGQGEEEGTENPFIKLIKDAGWSSDSPSLEVFSYSAAQRPRETAGHVRSDRSLGIGKSNFSCFGGSEVPRVLFSRFSGRVSDGHQSKCPEQILNLEVFLDRKHLFSVYCYQKCSW